MQGNVLLKSLAALYLPIIERNSTLGAIFLAEENLDIATLGERRQTTCNRDCLEYIDVLID